MVLGAGEMAENCVRTSGKKRRAIDSYFESFVRPRARSRHPVRAKAVCFGDCLFGMRDVDVVIAATSSSETLLSRDDADNLMKARCNRQLLLIDLVRAAQHRSRAGQTREHLSL